MNNHRRHASVPSVPSVTPMTASPRPSLSIHAPPPLHRHPPPHPHLPLGQPQHAQQSPQPPLTHSYSPLHRHQHQSSAELERDRDRDQSFSTSSSASKRLKMNGRPPSTDGYYSQHHASLPQPASSQPQPSSHLPGISRHYAQSPELERMNVSGPGYHPPPPPLPALQQQPQAPSRHEPLPPNGAINPTSNRGSPVFLPPRRTSTPDNHSHRRTPSYNSPHLSRGPPQDPIPPHSSVHHQPPQQSGSQPPQQQHHHQQHHHQQQHQKQQQQHHIRSMPPPSSPHRIPLPHSQTPQPLRHPPPPPSPIHQHSAAAGPPTPGFGPAPITSGRDLPAPHRPSMSISSMLYGSPPPPPNASASRQSDKSPLKGAFAPEFPSLDRSRDVGSSSASSSSGNTPLPGLSGHKQNRIPPPEPVYRAHQQLQHHSGVHSIDREAQYSSQLYGQRPPPSLIPTRPQSQPPGMHGMREDAPPRPIAQSGSFSERDMMYDRERQYERERYFETEPEPEREVREREMLDRGREANERQQMERVWDRERERAEGSARERERERERKRERGCDRERDKLGTVNPLFGRERMELQAAPQLSGSPLPYCVTITSKYGNQNGVAPPSAAPPPSSVSTPTTMSLPLQPPSTINLTPSTGGQGHHRPTPPPLSTACSTPRENFQPFSGYAVSMPPSPFSNSPSLPMPVVGDDARERDARLQRFKGSRDVGPLSGGGIRDEPLRAEDALQRGLNRSLSSLIEDDKKRNVGKDRDGIVKDKDGFMRLTDSAMAYQSPPRRTTGASLGDIGRNWSEHLPKELLVDRERVEREKTVGGGAAGVKRDREDDENSIKMDKKKRHHHHHHQHPFHHLNHHHHHHDDGALSLETPRVPSSMRSKSPLYAHHHHAHIHHHHSPLPTSSQQRIATALLIDSSKVLATLTSKPRNYLGSMVYLPAPTPKQGYSVTQPLLPRFEGRENSIFQIRIPKRFLSELHRKDVGRRRCVWGTEIYTDDSDVLGVLIHTGKIPPVFPEDADPALIKDFNRKVIVRGSPLAVSPVPAGGNWKPNGAAAAAKKNEDELPTIPVGKDLLVNVLILPPLERYTGTLRNTFKSRSWKTVHDGMSYSIWGIEWVAAGEAESRGGVSRKRRLDEREWVRRWGELPKSRGGGGMDDTCWAKGRWNLTESRNGNSSGDVEVGA